MKESPILYSGPMIQALLAGLKTQTRRLAAIQWDTSRHWGNYDCWTFYKGKKPFIGFGTSNHGQNTLIAHCPHGKPGDRLWVKESHFLFGSWVKNGLNKTGRQKWRFNVIRSKGVKFPDDPPAYVCRNSVREIIGWFKRPSIFMPRWAGRITLEITEVRVQRVQEISGDDARAEGIESSWPSQICQPVYRDYKQKKRDTFEWFGKAIDSFQTLWDSINAARGYGWAANPWVWAITFRRVTL